MPETSLHTALKDWYVLQGGIPEVILDGFLIDIVKGELLIEIQTRNFSAIKPKLNALLEHNSLRLVHPIAQEKWIVNLPERGDKVLSRRKSPRRGRVEHLFLELVRCPMLLTHPNFNLEILLIKEEEIRRKDGKGSWRRNGVSIIDRRLLEIVGQRLFTSPQDLKNLLPQSLPTPFTNQQLAQELKIPVHLAAKMTYCLRAAQILEMVGKHGRKYLYCQK